MAEDGVRGVDRRRWQNAIVGLLEELPRQYTALETAMAAFGDDFDLAAFKRAFETWDDMEEYNRAQAVERGIGRVQNFVADLAVNGVKLAQLPSPEGSTGSDVDRAFAALRDAGVIGAALCRRLVRAQRARARIEHAYVDTTAGDVHRAALLVHDSAREFASRYAGWVAPLLPG